MPFAIVQGNPITTPPKDLYIPPEALEVFLEAFEGPLDLLLYLIKKQNLDILDIPIAKITKQYMTYIDMMSRVEAGVGGRVFGDGRRCWLRSNRACYLPRVHDEEEEEDDPRAELIRRLQEYERYKKVCRRDR